MSQGRKVAHLEVINNSHGDHSLPRTNPAKISQSTIREKTRKKQSEEK